MNSAPMMNTMMRIEADLKKLQALIETDVDLKKRNELVSALAAATTLLLVYS